MKRLKFSIAAILYVGIIVAGTAPSLVHNTWHLINRRLPEYYINPLFLSGALLLFDRPMFFETRRIEVRENGQSEFKTLDFDLRSGPFETYVQRRLFRFATNELNCGCDRNVAFEIIYCQSTLDSLSHLDVGDIRIRFTPLIWNSPERVYGHRCKDAH